LVEVKHAEARVEEREEGVEKGEREKVQAP
jgi:hypothetical protein